MSKIRGSSFARNTALLSIGTAAAQGFSVLAAPVLTRLYLPSDIGELALFTSFISVASSCASLKYELGIVSAPDDSEAAELTLASVLLLVPVSILSGGVLYLAIRSSRFGFGSLPAYTTLLMVPALFLTGLFAALRYWTIRTGNFGLISRTFIGQHAVRAICQVSFGFVSANSLGLFTGELLGRAVGVAPMIRGALARLRSLLRDVSKGDLFRALNVNRKLVIYSLPSTFIDTLVANLPIPVIVSLYGSIAGGHLSLVQKVLAVPLGLIAASVADTFHGSLAACARESPTRVFALFRRTSLWLFVIGLVPALILAFFGRPLFQVVFGHKWAVAGTLAALSTPWFLTQFVVSPLSRLVFVLRGQELKLIYDIVILLGMFAVVELALHRHMGLLQTVWAFSLVNTLANLVYYLVLVWIVYRSTPQLSLQASG